jgi:8-oxo-dGTP pyrophosphatase MutT (NUDIX family)
LLVCNDSDLSPLTSSLPYQHDTTPQQQMSASPQQSRAFIIPIHPDHGVLLLSCTRKKKGFHHQAPGGRIDDQDYTDAQLAYPEATLEGSIDSNTYLPLLASRNAASRELFEETGIDIRSPDKRHRLIPLKLLYKDAAEEEVIVLEHNGRWFFSLRLKAEDFPIPPPQVDKQQEGEGALTKATQNDASEPLNLCLQLSEEHSGFTFEKDLLKASQMMKLHSKGQVSEALIMAMNAGKKAGGVGGVGAEAGGGEAEDDPPPKFRVSSNKNFGEPSAYHHHHSFGCAGLGDSRTDSRDADEVVVDEDKEGANFLEQPLLEQDGVYTDLEGGGSAKTTTCCGLFGITR